MAYKKVSQKALTSLPAIRKRTAITQTAKPLTVKKTSVSTTPVGRTNVGTQISGVTAINKTVSPNTKTAMNKTVSPNTKTTATVIKKPTTGVQYVSTTPSKAVLKKLKK